MKVYMIRRMETFFFKTLYLIFNFFMKGQKIFFHKCFVEEKGEWVFLSASLLFWFASSECLLKFPWANFLKLL